MSGFSLCFLFIMKVTFGRAMSDYMLNFGITTMPVKVANILVI